MAVKNVFLSALLVCALCGAQGAAANSDAVSRILVVGQGSVALAPDMAVINLSVVRDADTAAAALSANSIAMANVLSALVALGIEQRDLQTNNVSIQPRYTNPPRQGEGKNEIPKLVGYTARNGLTVRVRDTDQVGQVLDASVNAGVNEGGNILFANEDPAQAITEARISAMKDALAKGHTLATAAGVKVGKVLEISEQNYSPRPMTMGRMAMDSEAKSVPVAAGENIYKVIVNVSLAINQ